MSDNQNWQAPVSQHPVPPVQPPQPYAGQPQAPQYAAPQYGAPQGWTPPPKPGLVPLRPMTLGTVLGASFQVMRRNPRTTIVPALLVGLVLALAATAGVASYLGVILRISGASSTQDADAFAGGAVAIAILGVVIGVALAVAATALLQGIIVAEVARGTVGEKLRLGQIWSQYRGRLGVVVGYAALIVLVILVASALLILIMAAIVAGTAASGGGSGVGMGGSMMGGMFAAFGIVIVGYLGGAVLWAWLGTKLAFVPAAIVLERLPIRAAMRRSWSLTRGFFWRTFGIILLVGVMIYIAMQIVSVPVQLIFMLGTSLLDPTGVSSSSPDAMMNSFGVALIASYAVIALVSSIGLVVQSATSSLLYLDLRMRREGLDLELARYVEARATGAEIPDPYLPRSRPL